MPNGQLSTELFRLVVETGDDGFCGLNHVDFIRNPGPGQRRSQVVQGCCAAWAGYALRTGANIRTCGPEFDAIALADRAQVM